MTDIRFTNLPNFLIIGAAKSGTTSLFDVLTQHPQVYGAEAKEIHFFNNDERYSHGLEWYQDTYFRGAAGHPIRLEASTAYLTWSEKVAPRIKTVYGKNEIKFGAIFRDPVKRAYSHYWHRVRLGHEELPFPDALAAEDGRLKQNWNEFQRLGIGKYGYFRGGCYATRLQPFLDSFPRENFIFLLQEDILHDFGSAVARMLTFLGIDQTVVLQQTHSNASALPRSRAVYNLLKWFKKSGWKGEFKKIMPVKTAKWLNQTMNKLVLSPNQYSPMDAGIERQLRQRYRTEIEQLETILGRDLSSWKAV